MILKSVLQVGSAVGRSLLLKRRVPIFVSWNITFRCNRRCDYCGTHELELRELDTTQVLSGIDALYAIGTRWITFGGGEPLLRDDIRVIVDHAKASGMHVFVSTNGALVPSNLEAIRSVDKVTLSLDGPPEVHDRIRGPRAFEETIEALSACREAEIRAALLCTLSKHNLKVVDEVVRIAAESGVRVTFQPATEWLDSSTTPNPIAPPEEEYRQTMDQIIGLKRSGAPIANSLPALRHLSRWPNATKILCGAGRYFLCVEPDGRVLACHQAQAGELADNSSEDITAEDLASRVDNMELPTGCQLCWCAPIVEMAQVFSLKAGAIINAARVM